MITNNKVLAMMHNPPPHSGIFLNTTVIRPFQIGVTETALHLWMSRTVLSRVLNGKAGTSPDLTVRLERTGQSTSRFWVNLQANYDLWLTTTREQPNVIKLGVAV